MENVKIGDRVIINTLAKNCSFLPKLEATVTFIYEDGNLFVTAYNIEWEVDEDENTNLPINVIIPNRFLARDYVTKDGLLDKTALAENVADYLSDCYGYLIREIDFHVELH